MRCARAQSARGPLWLPRAPPGRWLRCALPGSAPGAGSRPMRAGRRWRWQCLVRSRRSQEPTGTAEGAGVGRGRRLARVAVLPLSPSAPGARATAPPRSPISRAAAPPVPGRAHSPRSVAGVWRRILRSERRSRARPSPRARESTPREDQRVLYSALVPWPQTRLGNGKVGWGWGIAGSYTGKERL